MKALWKRIMANRYWPYALYLPAYLLAFWGIERFMPADRVYWPSWIPLDDKIPFRAGFVYFYVMWFPYLVVPGVFWLLNEPETFRRYMLSIALGFTFAVIVCVVFPNCQNMRPDPVPGKGLAPAIVRMLYAADTNTNVLPSVHVIGAAVMAYACAYSPAVRRHGWMLPCVIVLAVMITLSTLFIKQHSALDVITALIVCVPLWFAVYGKRGIPAVRDAKRAK